MESAADTGDRPTSRRSAGQRLLREPLVHFLVVGVVLFAASAVVDRDPGQAPRSNEIELTLDDLRQLEIAFTSQWRRPPTPQEMVKRRMAQKMEFLAEDVSDAREPAAGELERWFAEDTERLFRAEFALC